MRMVTKRQESRFGRAALASAMDGASQMRRQQRLKFIREEYTWIEWKGVTLG